MDYKVGSRLAVTRTPGTLKIPKVLVRLADLRLCAFALNSTLSGKPLTAR